MYGSAWELRVEIEPVIICEAYPVSQNNPDSVPLTAESDGFGSVLARSGFVRR